MSSVNLQNGYFTWIFAQQQSSVNSWQISTKTDKFVCGAVWTQPQVVVAFVTIRALACYTKGQWFHVPLLHGIVSSHCLHIYLFGANSGLILNLENLDKEKGHFYKKSGKTWKIQGIFYNFYPSQGKASESKLLSQHIILTNSFRGCYIFVNKCELCHFV